MLNFEKFNADRNDLDFAYRLGKIFYQGSIYSSSSIGGISAGSEGVGAVPRNYRLARYYFLKIARQVWPNDPPAIAQTKDDDNKPFGLAAASAAYIGRMYLRGEGIKADPTLAKMWFERGAEHGDRECQNGLGLIYRDALVPGSRADMKQALNWFDAAASQELAEAQVNLGKYYYSESNNDLTRMDSVLTTAQTGEIIRWPWHTSSTLCDTGLRLKRIITWRNTIRLRRQHSIYLPM